MNLYQDFNEYDELINWLNLTSRRIVEIEREYKEKSKTVLQKAVEDGVDFKAIYGGNSEKTRRQYVDEQLSDLVIEKQELKLLKEDDLRRIEFLKRMIDMKIELVKYSNGDDEDV